MCVLQISTKSFLQLLLTQAFIIQLQPYHTGKSTGSSRGIPTGSLTSGAHPGQMAVLTLDLKLTATVEGRIVDDLVNQKLCLLIQLLLHHNSPIHGLITSSLMAQPLLIVCMKRLESLDFVDLNEPPVLKHQSDQGGGGWLQEKDTILYSADGQF